MEPRNPDWKARCEASFHKQAVMGTLGVSVAALTPGRVTLEMPFRADLTQQHGFLHACVVTTVLDSACGYAAFTLMPDEAEVLTVEFKSNFLAPARGDTFRFVGEVVKAGRTLMVTRGDAFAVRDGQQVAVSTMQATMMVVTGRADVAR
ncbi:PaaI family thioesterase [Yoonia sp. 208BN28-4]|uniref:PaaI family thioesterase n=1 Tax=Yoonia sp. 208BN28-4 TaxID=3126505 RepID=UPI0030B4AF4A